MKKLLSSTHPTVLGVLVAAAAATTSPAATLLWSIGTKDTNTAEFALGPKGYQDYQPLTINNKLPPEGQAAKVGIEMKPYRDYLSFSEKIDGAPQLKGQKYDTN